MPVVKNGVGAPPACAAPSSPPTKKWAPDVSDTPTTIDLSEEALNAAAAAAKAAFAEASDLAQLAEARRAHP